MLAGDGDEMSVVRSGFVLTFLLGAVLMLSAASLPLWRVCGIAARVRSLQNKQLENYSYRTLQQRRMQTFLKKHREQLVAEALVHGALLELVSDDVVIRCGPSGFWSRAVPQNGLLCVAHTDGQEWCFVV